MSNVTPTQDRRNPVAFGQYDGQVVFTSQGERDGITNYVTVPAVWPPDQAGTFSRFPHQQVLQVSSEFHWNQAPYHDWGFLENTDPAPDERISAFSYTRWVHSFTFDVRGLSPSPSAVCQLVFDLAGSPPAQGWIFAMQPLTGDPGFDVGPSNHSNTTRIHGAWIGGSWGQLLDIERHEEIFMQRAEEWPIANPACEIDLLAPEGAPLVTPDATYNVNRSRLYVTLRDWHRWISLNDWVSILFTTAVQPEHFWMWSDHQQFEPDATPYIGRNWVPFSSESVFLAGHPIFDVQLRITDIREYRKEVAATALWIPRIGASAHIPPDDRQTILIHKAVQNRATRRSQ